VIENGTILIDGNRISAVGPAATTSVPAGARSIDMSGKTILPGFFDAHWHGPHASDQVVPDEDWVYYNALAYGVTTIHDPSADTHEVFASSELQKAGKILGPRVFSTGSILYGADTPYMVEIGSLDDALTNLRRLKASGAWSVKSYQQPRREQRQMVIEAARQLGMEVVPEGGSLFQMNMSMIADGHTTIEHSLPVQHIYDDVVQYWRGSKTAWTPTLIVAYGGPFGEYHWYQHNPAWQEPIEAKWAPQGLLDARARRPTIVPDDEDNIISVSQQAKKISDLGIPVSIGAHGQRESLGAHWEIWGFALGGMSNLEALKTATINPARAHGLDHDLGSIEAGKLADLVVMDKNPLDDIHNTTSIRYTMINGMLLDGNLSRSAVRRHSQEETWTFPVVQIGRLRCSPARVGGLRRPLRRADARPLPRDDERCLCSMGVPAMPGIAAPVSGVDHFIYQDDKGVSVRICPGGYSPAVEVAFHENSSIDHSGLCAGRARSRCHAGVGEDHRDIEGGYIG
jgi:imidazolonepropionase-like amidohydrolase